MISFDGMKVFSATKMRERNNLGEDITKWMDENKDKFVVDREIRQSSDNEFHCLTIVIFWEREN